MLAATVITRSKPAGRSKSASVLLENIQVDNDRCDRIAHGILKAVTMNEDNKGPLKWEL